MVKYNIINWIMVGKKMLVSSIKEEDLSPELVDKLLFQGLEDTGESADCMIVLGSLKASQYRVPVAVEAYKAGRAKRIMLCGGKLRDFPDGRYSEAAHMQKAALQLGVAEEDMLLENASQHTVENIRFALFSLEKAFGLDSVHRVLLVTTAYHMRRSLAIARHLFPAHISIIPCPANDTHTRRDNWTDTSIGTERAKGEARKLIQYVNSGIIPDFEIV